MKITGLILLSALLTFHSPQDIYLYVDSNASESSSSFDAAGGREIFFVDTNASEYTVEGLPSWCVLENKSRTSFLLVCGANTGAERSFVFKVKAGSRSVRINVTQAESSGVMLASYPWRSKLDKVLENVTKTYKSQDGGSPDRYKGELNSLGKRHGLGIYRWNDGACYLGEYENGLRSGQGIYLIGTTSFQFGSCEGCIVYVGGYSAGKASGNGTCYDEYGRAIYRGNFTGGSPSEFYPAKGGLSDFRFEWVSREGGVYFGETFKGVPHGMGIFLADDGSAWLGHFTAGERSSGIELQYVSGKVRRLE